MYNIYQHFQRSNRPSLAYPEPDDDYLVDTHYAMMEANHESYYDHDADMEEEDDGPDPLRLVRTA